MRYAIMILGLLVLALFGATALDNTPAPEVAIASSDTVLEQVNVTAVHGRDACPCCLAQLSFYFDTNTTATATTERSASAWNPNRSQVGEFETANWERDGIGVQPGVGRPDATWNLATSLVPGAFGAPAGASAPF